MSPSPRVLRSALVIAICLGPLAAVPPSSAQQLETTRRSLDYAPDPLARSPRLLGMGRLTLADDLHNRISLWDFAGNPTGIAEAESVTTFEYRPALRSSSVVREIASGPLFRERQDLSARETLHGVETWRRAPGSAAYGLVAEFATLQTDRPFDANIERRGRLSVPSIGGAANGRVPWIKSDRFNYAVRLRYGLEVVDNNYFEFLHLPNGDYLGKPTTIASPPDLFTPDHHETSNLSGGVAFSARLTRGIKLAVGYDRARVRVRSTLEGLRSTSKVDEDRPFDLGQASVVGRLGPHVEWGADGRAWRSHSEEFFFWSISAGATQLPLSGSGKRLDRDERGTSLRTRARWSSGPLELGAGFGTRFGRTIVTPWYPQAAGDHPGFNDFLREVGTRVGADTLMLPASVIPSQIEERTWEVSGGGSLSLPGRRGVVGVEVHRRSGAISDAAIVGGPEPKGWDVRAGGEYRCSGTFLARLGWNYGINDPDDRDADDGYRSAVATGGFGLQPEGSRWSVDLGYAYEWVRADFVDPARSRGDRQHLAIQMRWPF